MSVVGHAGNRAGQPLREFCEHAYRSFHRPELISPDPLELVREFPCHRDREVVGLIASSLALGRVDGILAAAGTVIGRLLDYGDSPARMLLRSDVAVLDAVARGFVYRFFDESQLAGLLRGIRGVLRDFGSVETCLSRGLARESRTARGAAEPVPGDRLLTGLGVLVRAIRAGADGRLDDSILLSTPERGSACKRLLLYARWMVRRDAIDPGGWSVIAPDELLLPVDAHVLRVGQTLGLTARAQASLLVSREMTAALREVDASDPVRFDFSLTRPGIHPLLDEKSWLAERWCTRSA